MMLDALTGGALSGLLAVLQADVLPVLDAFPIGFTPFRAVRLFLPTIHDALHMLGEGLK